MSISFLKKSLFLFLLLTFGNILHAQNRVDYLGKKIFINGTNIAWINYSRDLGPTALNLTKFKKFFEEFHNAGGNVMRLWLHNDATATPVFDNAGYITGPGSDANSNLKQILDAAHQYNVALQLCLFGFNLQRRSIGEPYLSRNKKFLTDTIVIRSYINNSLIPMVNYVKGHPAIFAWEIFNEPEGMTNEFGWGDINHVPMADIQRFVNLLTGAIHRADPSAKVTNGANRINTSSDVTALAKVSPKGILNLLTSEQKQNLEYLYKVKYDFNLTAEEIINHFYKPNAGNFNYYRDDRLIAAGGDPLGTLDFYNIHFYSDGGTSLSPFHHTYSYWNLDKPLVVAEFFMEGVANIQYSDLYENLFQNGYSGAMSWQWLGDTSINDGAKNENHSRTVATLQNMFLRHKNDILLVQQTGSIYSFNVSPLEINQGQTVTVSWETTEGSVVSINGEAVEYKGTKTYQPDKTTTYTISTNGENPSTISVTVQIIRIPSDYSLEQNYPNPFNQRTIVSYKLPVAGYTSLKVYDLLGREIITLVNEEKLSGNYSEEFNVKSNEFASGVYFYQLRSGSFTQTKKMIMIK